jgi:TPR repeat protein
MTKNPALLKFLCILAISTHARAELVCELGKADFTFADTPVGEISSEAAALRASAKGKDGSAETARQRRLELAYTAIESALKSEAVNEIAKATAYWRLVKQDLGDTAWRMSQEVKAGNARARWLSQELAEHGKPAPWPKDACDALGAVNAAESASALYRHALCAAKTSPKAALEFMKNAAIGGHPAALEAYGRLCAEQGKEGRACAVEMLCRAADAGRKSAAGLAAYILTSETPTPALAVKAAALYEMAYSAGDAASANNLGEVYERGWIGRPNLAQAQAWYRLASEAGLIQANLNLARLLWRTEATQSEARSLIDSARTTMPTEAEQLLLQLEGSRD